MCAAGVKDGEQQPLWVMFVSLRFIVLAFWGGSACHGGGPKGLARDDGDAPPWLFEGSKLHVVETEEFKKRRGEELAAQGAIEKAEVVEEPSPSPMEGDAPGSLPDTPTLPREAPGGPGSAEARLVSQISAISSEVDELSSQVGRGHRSKMPRVGRR